eukprot:9200488-Alexandrium_andersonii.AAC.1
MADCGLGRITALMGLARIADCTLGAPCDSQRFQTWLVGGFRQASHAAQLGQHWAPASQTSGLGGAPEWSVQAARAR